jgi:hypothetical protein
MALALSTVMFALLTFAGLISGRQKSGLSDGHTGIAKCTAAMAPALATSYKD